MKLNSIPRLDGERLVWSLSHGGTEFFVTVENGRFGVWLALTYNYRLDLVPLVYTDQYGLTNENGWEHYSRNKAIPYSKRHIDSMLLPYGQRYPTFLSYAYSDGEWAVDCSYDYGVELDPVAAHGAVRAVLGVSDATYDAVVEFAKGLVDRTPETYVEEAKVANASRRAIQKFVFKGVEFRAMEPREDVIRLFPACYCGGGLLEGLYTDPVSDYDEKERSKTFLPVVEIEGEEWFVGVTERCDCSVPAPLGVDLVEHRLLRPYVTIFWREYDWHLDNAQPNEITSVFEALAELRFGGYEAVLWISELDAAVSEFYVSPFRNLYHYRQPDE